MALVRLRLDGVRNLEPIELKLSPYLNLVHGDNGAGKSSLLEALTLLTSGRSFRTPKLTKVIQKDKSALHLFAELANGDRLGVQVEGDGKKLIRHNQVDIRSTAALAKILPLQVISPESYHLVDAGPGERRKFLDWSLFHVEQNYFAKWKAFNNLLRQRNAVLKSHSFSSVQRQISVWDEPLCELAEEINRLRHELLESINPHILEFLRRTNVVARGEYRFDYYPGHRGELGARLKADLEDDFRVGFTRHGPHKADLRMKVGSDLAKDALSRGQKKLLINVLFLAQTRYLKLKTDKESLFVIDDFASELDRANQQTLLGLLLDEERVQIILSSLTPFALKDIGKVYNRARLFHVEQGRITPE